MAFAGVLRAGRSLLPAAPQRDGPLRPLCPRLQPYTEGGAHHRRSGGLGNDTASPHRRSRRLPQPGPRYMGRVTQRRLPSFFFSAGSRLLWLFLLKGQRPGKIPPCAVSTERTKTEINPLRCFFQKRQITMFATRSRSLWLKQT